MEFKAVCNCCPVIADCKVAFGKFWQEKSHGGVGCAYPFPGWGKTRPTMPKLPTRPKRMAANQGEMILRPVRVKTERQAWE